MKVASSDEAPEKSVWHIVRETYMNIAWTWCHCTADLESIGTVVRHDNSPATCVMCLSNAWANTWTDE